MNEWSYIAGYYVYIINTKIRFFTVGWNITHCALYDAVTVHSSKLNMAIDNL